ncbi:MAG TPA: hypothetical protein VEO92_06875, partial [Candidatus Nitrosocosmicus sp.]|nr:hypothetical protein [Candidatus Nitrosocosmicus sp.]
MKNFQLVFSSQESEAIYDWDQVVGWHAGFRTNSAAGAGRFGAKKNLINTALLDRGFEVVNIVDTGVVEEILAEIPLSDVLVGWDKTVQA